MMPLLSVQEELVYEQPSALQRQASIQPVYPSYSPLEVIR